MNPNQKLGICKQTRTVAIKALEITLSQVLKTKKQISEVGFRDLWLKELRKNFAVFADGWYIPPPHGISVLFGTDENIQRVNTTSIRPPEFWPKDDAFLDFHKGIIFLYASPVDKKSGIIGDFGLTMYLGSNTKIKKHLQKCWQINHEIFGIAQEGMKFCELYVHTQKILAAHNLVNDLLSPSDPTGTNMGHTIPASYEDWQENEKVILHNAEKNWPAVCDMISHKRKFVNSVETQTIQAGMALTIEPRPFDLNDPIIPRVYFHTIALFKGDHHKEFLADFRELFKLAGMDYLLS